MSRKSTFTVLTALLLFVLAVPGLQERPVRAEGDSTPAPGSDLPVYMEITGTIQALNARQLTLTDGSVIQITKDTQITPPKLKVGMAVVIEAEFDTDEFVAHTITLADAAEEVATLAPTAAATSAATAAPTKAKGNGKGNGNGDDDNQGDNPGKGNGKGNGNGGNGNQGDNPGKGNGKGNGNGNDDDKKGDKDPTECLKNTTHPVATRLAEALGVSYAEIMGWHCKGYGFGEIARAYLIARKSSMTVQQILDARKAGKGWGEILKEAGVDPGDVAPGQIMGKGQGKGHGKDK